MAKKKCCKCKELKSLQDFHFDKAIKDGFANNCKECQKAYAKEYYQKQKKYVSERSELNRSYLKSNMTEEHYVLQLNSIRRDNGIKVPLAKKIINFS